MEDLQQLLGTFDLDLLDDDPDVLSGSEPATFAPPASDDFILVSSGGDRIPVKKMLLIANSAVFRDMHEVVTTDEDEEHPSCSLTERTSEVTTFLAALVEGSTAETPRRWLSLFRMVDKYQVPILWPVLKLGAR